MAIGGDLISSFPASGLSASEIPLGTAADNEDLAALPNESAKVIIENEHGEEVPLAEASASTPPALRHDGSFTKPISAASSSQDTLAAPVACEKTLKDVPVSTLASAGLTGLERQLERVNDNLEAGQEARLDFTSVSLDVRQAFILKVTKALLSFGSPSHRVEADLDFAAEIVGVPAQFVHHPNCVGAQRVDVQKISLKDRSLRLVPFTAVVNFGVAGSHLSDTITVKHQNGGLDLGSVSGHAQHRFLQPYQVTVHSSPAPCRQSALAVRRVGPHDRQGGNPLPRRHDGDQAHLQRLAARRHCRVHVGTYLPHGLQWLIRGRNARWGVCEHSDLAQARHQRKQSALP